MKSSPSAEISLKSAEQTPRKYQQWHVVVGVLVCLSFLCSLLSVYLPANALYLLLTTLLVFVLMFVALFLALKKTKELQKERNDLSKQQKQSRFRLDNFLKNNPAVIYTADTSEDFPIRYITPNVKELTGYTADDFENDPFLWKSIIEEKDQMLPFKDVSILFKEGHRIVDYRIRHKDGRLRWIRDEMRLVASEGVGAVQVVGNWLDVTARKVSEQIMRESESRFHSMAENASFMIWVSNQKGACVFFNKAWLQFRGRSLIQEMGQGWLDGVHDFDKEYVKESILEARSLRKPFDLVYRLKDANGIFSYVQTQASPRYLKDGTFYGYIGSTIDITDLKEAMKAVDEVSVDYYSKMALCAKALLGPIDGLKKHLSNFSSNESAELWIEQANTLIGHLHDKTQLIVDISRLKSHQQCLVHGKFYPVDFFEKWSKGYSQAPVLVLCEISEKVPRVLRVDTHLLQQVCSLIVEKLSIPELTGAIKVFVEWRDTLVPHRLHISFSVQLPEGAIERLCRDLSKKSKRDMHVILIEDIVSELQGSILCLVEGETLDYTFEIPLKEDII